MPVKLYMDENVPRQITLGLRLRGIDVLIVQEDDRSGIAVSEVLARATELQRVLFTDFFAIAATHLQAEIPFSGIIYAHQQPAALVIV